MEDNKQVDDLHDASYEYAGNNYIHDYNEVHDAFEAGANWQKQQSLPISDEEIEKLANNHQYGGYEWQKEKRISFIQGYKAALQHNNIPKCRCTNIGEAENCDINCDSKKEQEEL